MKSIAKFLLAVFSFAPMTVSGAPISTTAGSNLTGYNGSMGSVMGNQWNNATNARQNMQNSTAKADFGNCNALILRCATPKCASGGCVSAEIARPIVAGCVAANSTCKKHGDALIDAISAQLVSNAVAAQNQQAAAAQAAAAQSAAQQSAQQIAEMQQQMSQQMAMMQEQNAQQIASLQDALAESQRATADAIQSANESRSSSNMDTFVGSETGLTAVQNAAAKSGVSEELITRSTISGQILTSMEGVETSLNNLKTTMRTAFKYGGCNEVNGNSCKGPKRISKFRDLAKQFFEPYDALESNLEEALYKAQSVGVDLGNIYMFFSGSCNRWAEYVCTYQEEAITEQVVVGNEIKTIAKMREKVTQYKSDNCIDGMSKTDTKDGIRGNHACAVGQVVPPEDLLGCSVNKILDAESDKEITERILNPESSSTGTVRVGCASNLSAGLIRHRNSSSKSKNGIDIDLLEILINQNESGSKFDKECKEETVGSSCYCGFGAGKSASGTISALKAATVSKTLKVGGKSACCSKLPTKTNSCNVDCYDISLDVSYVDPVFALCDTHAWNIQSAENVKDKTTKEQMKEIIGLKTTVMAQQMYKQYSTLETMIKQVKILLEKEVLKSNLKVASGTGEGNDEEIDSDSTFSSCGNRGDDNAVLACLRSNVLQYEPLVKKSNVKNSVMKQMHDDMEVLKIYVRNPSSSFDTNACKERMSKSQLTPCYNALQRGIRELDDQIEEKNKKTGGFRIVTD
jgi:hypothetical protein